MTDATPTADTPVIRQYREIKAKHPNAILFFRMGDFYEMFFDDAKLAASVLGLTLTTRNNGAAADVPLAGVPVKAATDYVRRLVARGHRVAICEQMEDPQLAKGIVRRAVIETVTPGAVLADALLDGNDNNFLLAVTTTEQRIGLAALDVSTGEFVLETIAPSDLPSAIARYRPREIVIANNAERPAGIPPETMVTPRDAWEFDAALAAEELTNRFHIASLAGLGVETIDQLAVAAGGAALRYAAELQPGGLPHIGRPAIRRVGAHMQLDEMTRRNLELVEPLRTQDGGVTLLNLLNTTKTPMGSRLLRQWLVAPLINRSDIDRRHDAVELLKDDDRGRSRLRDALDGVRDVERLASRAAAHRATPRDLGALRDSLHRMPDVRSALDGLSTEHSTELERITDQFDLVADLAAELDAMLVPRPPASLGDGETIRRAADAALDEARDLRDGGKQFIADLQAQERAKTGIPSLKIGYNRVFGYYIEITKTHRQAVPSHYERRQTLTNAERYATPQLKEYEARVLDAEDTIATRERELLDRLCDTVQARLTRIQRTAQLVATLDVLSSFADTANIAGYCRPTMTDGTELELVQCRHPVVERMLPVGKFIPNDIRLTPAQRVMLLTGPNMAGKSTILRQVGLNVLMAQIGSFIPADSGTIGVVDRIFTRVGASDDLNGGQSTFMVEMSETSAILHCATVRSLVLLDEIGRGTSTYDGVAIAWGVTEHLHDHIGAKTIFATHYHELTQLTEELQHAVNFNVAVREVGEEIVFVYRLTPGGADRSYGIHVARLAGLPEAIVHRARTILRALESGHHVAGVTAPEEPDPTQLALFETGHPIVSALLALDPNRLTPMEALAQLADLRRRAEES
jgi:DNA mismatch repair protein MutS